MCMSLSTMHSSDNIASMTRALSSLRHCVTIRSMTSCNDVHRFQPHYSQIFARAPVSADVGGD